MFYTGGRGPLAILKRKLVQARTVYAERGLRALARSAVDEIRHETPYDLLRLIDPISPDPIMDRD